MSPERPPTLSFDTVVIGAGSAGCAAAGRLAASSDQPVCLVEAGPDYGPRADGAWPADLADARRSPSGHDWGHRERRAGGSLRPAPAARVLGGGSAYNHAAAMWAPAADYDAWADHGGDAWRHDALRPAIDALEADAGGSPWRGTRGALPTAAAPPGERAAWQRAFFAAARAVGLAELGDISEPSGAPGVAPLHLNARDHVRWNAAFAFVDPVRARPNFTVHAQTRAERLLFEAGPSGRPRVAGVRCLGPSGPVDLRARRVVVCAGAYGSPALLCRSGVGPAEELARIGVSVVCDRRGVGANLQEHPGAVVVFEPSAAGARALAADLDAGRRVAAQVIARAQSPRARGASDVHLIPHQERRDGDEIASAVLVFAVDPRSRGRLTLSGPRLDDPLGIDLGLFSDADGADLEALAWGVARARELASQPALAELLQRELAPGAGARDDRALRRYLREQAITYCHAAGTCRMGRAEDPDAVVDGRGAVHGVDGLYVADASIMPSITRAGPNLTCMLIGWKVADGLAGS